MKLTISQQIIRENEHINDGSILALVITPECKKIRNRAFANCKNLTSVIIEQGDDEISIEFNAFKGCNAMVMFQTKRPICFYKDINIRRIR